jgi:hypothetical protein
MCFWHLPGRPFELSLVYTGQAFQSRIARCMLGHGGDKLVDYPRTRPGAAFAGMMYY